MMLGIVALIIVCFDIIVRILRIYFCRCHASVIDLE